MRFPWAAIVAALASSAPADAKPPPSHTPPPPRRIDKRPAEPLPMLPAIARVRVEAARDRVILLEEVNLPRGGWRSGHLDLYVAFGSPGTPAAIEARLLTVAAGDTESRLDDLGERVGTQTAIRADDSAEPLLGRPQMAGVVVHVAEAQLRRAYETTDTVALRIRSLLRPPSADASGARDIVIRLGVAGGLPMTIGRIQVASLERQPWITRAEATLCGPEADPWPLSVSLSPKASGSPRVPGPIAPAAAVRHASDDLCVRWWAPP